MYALRQFLSSSALLLIGSVLMWGQTGTATLSGEVRDSSGAVVPGAGITLTNNATAVAKTTTTTSGGLYVVPNLVPGTYTLKVVAKGFQTREISYIKLEIDQQASIDVSLRVGSTEQQVTVTDQAAALQTEDASVGTVIQAQQVQNLPLNGRFFTQLLQLSPGTSPSIRTPGFNKSDPSLAGHERNGLPVFDVNGGNGAFTYFQTDGIENTEREFGGANIPMSVDAIQEVKIQTADFSAEYGRSPAQVDVVTKTGTNTFHGTLFEFLRNDALDASQWTFAGPAHTTEVKRNQFGGNFGGPIIKSKLFFFFNYDGTREVFTAPQTLTVPSDPMRSGVFPAGEIIFDPATQQPFPNNTIPSSRFDPIAVKVLQQVLPAPNLPGIPVVGTTSGLPLPTEDNYFYNPRHQQTINQYSGRVDYSRSESNSFFGRYTYSPNDIVADGPLATNLQGSIVGSERATLGGSNLSVSWIHGFGTTRLNEARFGFDSNPQLYAKGDNRDWASMLGLKQFLAPNAFPGLPHFRIGSVNLGSGDYRPLQVGEHNYHWVDNYTWIHGTHNIRMGGAVRRTTLSTLNSENSTGRFFFNGVQTRDRSQSGATTFCPGGTDPTACAAGDPMADFLLGDLSHFQQGSPIATLHKYFSSWAGYVNDTWHVRQNLTLNLGLRYEYTTRFHADPASYAMPILRNNEFASEIGIAQQPNGDLSPRLLPQAQSLFPGVIVGCKSVGLPSNCLISEKNDWQPRIGFDWQATEKTVLRAGAGIFYGYFNGDDDTEDGELFPITQVLSTPTFTQPPTGSNPPPLLLSNPLAQSSLSAPFLYGSYPNRRLPQSYQWNLTVERQLSQNMTVSAGYVASLSRHLEDLQGYCCYYDIPQPVGVVLAPGQSQVQVDPRFSNVEMIDNKQTSSYESLQLRLERRFTAGLGFTASYTYSKVLGVLPGLSDPLNPAVDRGPLDFDLTHNFVFAPVWQIPLGAGRRWLNAGGPLNQILGGWQFSTIIAKRSGFPFTPTLTGTDLLNMNGYSGEDRPDRVCSGNLSHPTVFNWFDKSCFVLPQEPTTPGAALRPGNSGYNILRGAGAFSMDTGLSKSFSFTERTGLEFRWEAFNVFNHPTFGLPDATIAPSGNSTPAQITKTTSLPRIMQFALKLHF